MAKVNIFNLVKTISSESIEHPDVTTVKVDGEKDLPKNVKEDTRQEDPDDEVDASVTNTNTTEPGPANGGGDGTAEFNSAEKATTKVNTKDLHFDGDQNGGRDIDELPNKVKAKDGLSASDVRTSVEEHEASGEVAEIKTIETGGAEAVEEADDLVMDIDAEVDGSDVTGILSQSELDAEVMGKILKDVGELEKAKASVERYIDLLSGMEKRGVELSHELRTSMSIGLESISEDLFKKEIITLEEFRVSNEDGEVATRNGPQGELDDDTEFDGARDKTKKGLSGKLKQIYEAIKKALKRAFAAAVDMWHSFVSDTSKLKEHLAGLRKRVTVLEGGKTIKLGSAARLMHGSEFVGGSSAAVKQLAGVSKVLLADWPGKLSSTIKEVRQVATGTKSNLTEEQIQQKFVGVLNGVFTSFRDLSPSDRSKAPSGFQDVYKLQWSEALVGNRAVYVGHKDSNDNSDINNFIKIVFSAIPGTGDHSGEVTIESPSAGEAATVIRELERLIDNVEQYREGMLIMKRSAELIEGDSMGHGARAFKDKDAARLQAVNTSLALLRGTTEAQHHYVGYLISTIKAYIGFLEGAIKTEHGDVVDA